MVTGSSPSRVWQASRDLELTPTMASRASFSLRCTLDRLLRPSCTYRWQAPHSPLPPHLLMMAAPASLMACSRVVPAGASKVMPAGRMVSVVMLVPQGAKGQGGPAGRGQQRRPLGQGLGDAGDVVDRGLRAI